MPIWCKGLSDEIIGIKMREVSIPWQSSSPFPEIQLHTLKGLGHVDWFREYNKNEELAKLIKGKKIAYVCPSPHLKGKKMGKLIDSYDLVIRVNQSFHMPKDMWEDYGKRTDILMSCLNINKAHALGDNMEYVQSLKYIVCANLSMWDIKIAEEFLDYTEVPWHNVCDGYLFKVFREVGTTCNTGLMGIITLLNYDIAELYVTGMTFFNMNTFGKVYYDKYRNEAAKREDWAPGAPDKELTAQDLRMDVHHQFPQIQYFNKIILKHKDTVLKIDDYLKENFNLAYSGFLENYSDAIIDELIEIDLFLKTKYKTTISNVVALEHGERGDYALNIDPENNILNIQSSPKINYAIEVNPWEGNFK